MDYARRLLVLPMVFSLLPARAELVPCTAVGNAQEIAFNTKLNFKVATKIASAATAKPTYTLAPPTNSTFPDGADGSIPIRWHADVSTLEHTPSTQFVMHSTELRSPKRSQLLEANASHGNAIRDTLRAKNPLLAFNASPPDGFITRVKIFDGGNAMTTGIDEHIAVISKIVSMPDGKPVDKNRMKSFIGGVDCTLRVTIPFNGSSTALLTAYGLNAISLGNGYDDYIRNPTEFTLKNPDKGANFAALVSAAIPMLTKCFQPATNHDAYIQLKLGDRLGVLSTNGQAHCEALLISKDHVLTARHCWIQDAAIKNQYDSGLARFTTANVPETQYQVCGAVAKNDFPSTKLTPTDEQIVLRIAPVKNYVPPIAIALASDIQPMLAISSEVNDKVTKDMAVYAWIPNAQNIDKNYQNNFAIGKSACYVQSYDEKNQCFTHMCATYPGTSGGPIFIKVAGFWKLLAVHMGGAIPDNGIYRMCTAKPDLTQNAAVIADSALISAYLEEGK